MTLAKSLRTLAFWSLVVVSVFNALSAVGGGIAILITGDLGMPDWFLDNGPFTSFTIPALVLLIVVGGTQALASVLLIARRESAYLWSAVAGFGMLIWIFVETGMIEAISVLQVVYFVTGGVQLVLVVALLGVVSWMPRQPLRKARAA